MILFLDGVPGLVKIPENRQDLIHGIYLDDFFRHMLFPTPEASLSPFRIQQQPVDAAHAS